MKRALLLFCLIAGGLCVPASAQNAAVQGWCELGGIKVSLQGMTSTNTVQASYPRCNVTVYLTGTTTKATIYSTKDGLTQLSNPFTAATNGAWTFYSATGVALDVSLNGGTPIAMPQTYTLVDVPVGGGGGGGGGLPSGTGIVKVTNGVGGLAGFVDVVNTFNADGTCVGFLKSDGTCGLSTASAAGTILGQIQMLGTAGSFAASAAIADAAGNVLEKTSAGYKQNPDIAIARTRDGVLQLTMTPQDVCPNAGSGNNEDSVCFNRAIQFLNSINAPQAIKTLRFPSTVNGYYFGATNAVFNLPRDFGDYTGFAGFVRAGAVNPVIANGTLMSCTSSGMVGYAPNANIPVLFVDPSGLGSGANATVLTDASGNSTGACTVTSAGMGYASIGVQGVPIPLGGDGAVGTVDLVSGVITNPQLSANGHGYTTGIPAYVPGLAGCTGTLPALTTTVSSATATITSFAVTQGGTACTFGGNANATGIPVAFGNSCLGTQGTAQCSLMAPEAPTVQACSVIVKNGVNIIGDGNPIIHSVYEFDTGKIATTEPAVFCDADGTQLQAASSNPGSTASVPNAYSMKISGFTIRGFVGFWFPGVVENLRISDITFEGAVPWIFGSVFRTNNFIAGVPYNATVIENSSVRANSAGVCGGGWTSRNVRSGAGGVMGGNVMGHPDNNQTPYYWGQCRNLQINNVSFIGSMNATLDTFFETNIWKTQNGPTTPGGTGLWTPLSNGSTSCPDTTTVVDRTTDFVGGAPYQAAQAGFYPYYLCYPGISAGGFSAIPRFWDGVLADGLGRGISITTFNSAGTTRPALTSLNSSNVYLRDIYTDNGAGSPGTDPYLPVGQTRHLTSVYGTTKINGSAQDIFIARGFYADGLQVRQANTASPFPNPLQINNVFNVQNQNFPFAVVTAPTSTSPCQQGQFVADSTGSFIYFCTATNIWRRAALSAF
jgi:hypothetical protein